MPTYDARPVTDAEGKPLREPGAIQFPVPVRIVDPLTGQRIPNAFYCRTNPPQVGRFLVDTEGKPLAKTTGRKIGGKRMNLYTADKQLIARDKTVSGKMLEYERWDVYEDRAWVAISLVTHEVVAKSEGAV